MKEFSDDDRLYLDDLPIGQRFTGGTHVVDEEQIKAFARQFDPQPFHLDNEVAKDTLFSGLAASGWHTAAITTRLLVEGGSSSPAVLTLGLAANLIGQIQPGPVTVCWSKVKSWTLDPRDPSQIAESPRCEA
jgi:acyl dehydratase